MRPIKVFVQTIDPKTGRRVGREYFRKATFLQFSTWGEEGNISPCAIIEYPEGNVTEIALDLIMFDDKEV